MSVLGLSQALQLGVLQVVSDTQVVPSDEGLYPFLHSQNSPFSVVTLGGHEAMQPFLSGLTFFEDEQVRQVCALPVPVHVAQPAVVKGPSH